MSDTLDGLEVSFEFRNTVRNAMNDDSVLDTPAQSHLAVFDDSDITSAVPTTLNKARRRCFGVIVVPNKNHRTADLEFSALTIRAGSNAVFGIHDAHLAPGNGCAELQELVRGRRGQHVNRVVDASSAETNYLDRKHDDGNQ